MKKCLTLILSVCFMAITAHAQFAAQVTFQHAFTKPQVDSILSAHGVPNGALTTYFGVRMYKVIYNTVGVDSLPTTASGLMIVPQNTPCNVPILSYQHNNVFAKNNAPSRYRNEWFIGLAAGSMGIITVMPDGLGLGSGSGQHPFLHRQSEATPVVDMIRAAKEVVDTMGNGSNGQLFLAGICEGAFASIAAHQYIQTYLDSSMHVTGTGAIAGYDDLSGTLISNMILNPNPYNDASFLPALFLTYNRIYHFAANDSDIFVHPYDSILPPMLNGSMETYQINGQIPQISDQVLQQSIIDTLTNDSTNFFRQLLQKNDIFNWTPTSPLDLFFCNADEIIPYQNSVVAYQHFVGNGSTTTDTLNIGATYDHNLCSQFSTLLAIQVINHLLFQPIESTIQATPSTSASNPNGTVTVHDTLGNPPFTYHWNNGDSTATITGLPAGTYYVTVTDQSHCTKTDSAVVTLLSGIHDLSLENIQVYPNPTHSQLVVDYAYITEKIADIELLDINGNTIEAPIVKGDTNAKIDLSANAKGVYILHVRSQSGADFRRKVVLL